MQFRRIITVSFILFSSISVSACSGDSAGDPFSGTGGGSGTGGTVGTGGGSGAGGTAGSGGTAAAGGTGGVSGGCQLIECAGRLTLCGDCIDNDDDGLVDNDDPECLGPCDNTEGANLLTGVGGETGRQCPADCYFDFGNGRGGGDCRWDRSCDPLEPKVEFCSYEFGLAESEGGNSLAQNGACPDEQPATCENDCAPLTPNGCDCFGCCTFPDLKGMGPDGGDGYVFLGSVSDAAGTCTLATVDQPDLCRPCTPAGSCLNTCERCEICLGKPTIDPDCFPGTGGTGGSGTGGMGGSPGGERCSDGKQACGLPGDAPCESGGFCLTGCCVIVQ